MSNEMPAKLTIKDGTPWLLCDQWFEIEQQESDPPAGNIGRLIFNTTSSCLKVDNGTAFITLILNDNSHLPITNKAEIPEEKFPLEAYQDYCKPFRFLMNSINNILSFIFIGSFSLFISGYFLSWIGFLSLMILVESYLKTKVFKHFYFFGAEEPHLKFPEIESELVIKGGVHIDNETIKGDVVLGPDYIFFCPLLESERWTKIRISTPSIQDFEIIPYNCSWPISEIMSKCQHLFPGILRIKTTYQNYDFHVGTSEMLATFVSRLQSKMPIINEVQKEIGL